MTTQEPMLRLNPYQQLRQLAEQVLPGMRRAHVERIFPRSNGGIQGYPITIYNEYPGARVEVQFSNTGDQISPEDYVRAPARVFMTIDW